MEQRREQVMFETQNHRIVGTVTLAGDGYRSRLSDMLNASEQIFIPVTGASVEPLTGGEAVRHEFLALGREHVVYAVALD
ncbi:MAG: hypothetical protein NVSMB51_14400 [Solirubrobacteraceae bacterium]